MAAIKDEKKIRRVAPPIGTRLLVENVYGITVEEQKAIEQQLDSLTDIRPLPVDRIAHHLPDAWEHYYREYVHQASDHRRPGIASQVCPLDEIYSTCTTAPIKITNNWWTVKPGSFRVGIVPRDRLRG